MNDRPMRPSLAAIRNPLQEALDNYHEIERRLREVEQHNNDLRVQNGALTAEVGMLREALERADSDRIRLQAVASTFLGGVKALNAVTTDLVQLAIKNGVEAEAAAKPEERKDLNAAGAEAREIIERTVPAHEPATPGSRLPSVGFNR